MRARRGLLGAAAAALLGARLGGAAATSPAAAPGAAAAPGPAAAGSTGAPRPILVLTSLDADVSLIDPRSYRTIRRIPTGKEPHHLY
ncbi:MAG: YncE family protein, partial [Pseudomonadota bacterium]